MSELVVYERACIALAEAKRVDEVLEIYSRTAAVRAYAAQSKNRTLELDAVEIRLRATRRLGQLLNAILEDGHVERGLPKPNTPLSERHLLKIVAKDCGVHYNLAITARKMAAITDAHYAKLIAEWRQRCLDENKVNMQLLPREQQPRDLREQEPEPPKPKGPLDNYWLAAGHGFIGDCFCSDIDGLILKLADEIKVLMAVRERMGDIEQLSAVTKERLTIRNVVSNAQLLAILQSLNIDYREAA